MIFETVNRLNSEYRVLLHGGNCEILLKFLSVFENEGLAIISIVMSAVACSGKYYELMCREKCKQN
jgi:hypothetical protein